MFVDGTPSFSEDALKDVLRESIQELPEGPLKAALCENFEEHFDKLKRYVSTHHCRPTFAGLSTRLLAVVCQ